MKARKIPTDKKRWEAGQWLKRQREQRGHVSQKAFAGMLDINPVQLSRIENGASGISVETLNKAIEILGLEAFEAYEQFGLLPRGARMSKDIQQEASKTQASRIGEVVANFSMLSPAQQAQALAIIKVLGADRPESLQITSDPPNSLQNPLPSEPPDGFPTETYIRDEKKGGRK